MKTRLLILSLFCLGCIPSLFGQRSFRSFDSDFAYNKAVYLELGGNGLIYSFNYDMRLQRGRQDGVGFKIGLGGLGGQVSSNGDTGRAGYLAIPATFNYLLGKRRHALEMGFGATFFHASAGTDFGNDVVSGSALLPHANLGYRYQALNDGFTFRLTLTPFIGVAPFAGISFGFNFK